MSKRRLWLGAAIVFMVALAYNFAGLATTPPGLDRDAAANGLIALNWLRAGLFPFWMPHASAPEPLIVWLQTATTALLGPSVAALRSASALFLSAAAVITCGLAWEVARPWPTPQRGWAALLAGLVFACNPVLTQIARTGLRAATLPLLSALFFLCLLHAWRTNRARGYALSGTVLGITAYTYLAARFVPVAILIFMVLAWWAEGGQKPDMTRVRGLLLIAATALVVVLPQLAFFAQYPNAFWERAENVSLLSNPLYVEVGLLGLLAQKAWAMLLIFGTAWSGQYNQAARPLLLPLPALGLVLALPWVWRWRRRPAMLLIVVALLVMLLPDLIGGDRLQPHELRISGAYVPVMVLCGLGLAYGASGLVRVIRRGWAWPAAGLLAALLVVGWGVIDWFGLARPALAQSDYAWFARPEVRIAETINAHDQPMLIPLNEYSRSVVAYLSSRRVTQLRSGINAAGQTVQPSSAQVLLLWPAEPERPRVESTSYRFDPAGLVLIDGDHAYLMPPAHADVAQLQQACDAQSIFTETGEAAVALCRVDFAALQFPAQLPGDFAGPVWRVDDLYAGALRLQAVTADHTELAAGASLGITSLWQAEAHGDNRWRYFVHVLDDHQQVIAGDDLIPGYGVYDPRLWQRDEIVPLRQVVQLPDNLPAGRYWIEVGLYDPLNGVRARVQPNGQGPVPDRTLVGPLKVPLAESGELPAATPLVAHFGDEIALDGYTVTHTAATLQVTLRLAALRPPQHDYTVFVHVEDAAGEIVAQVDAPPRGGQYPTGIWSADEGVVDTWEVALPAPLPAGSYRIWIGLYEWQSGARLPVQADGAVVDADRLLLQEIEVR